MIVVCTYYICILVRHMISHLLRDRIMFIFFIIIYMLLSYICIYLFLGQYDQAMAFSELKFHVFYSYKSL